jgi:hypothetical protein
METTAKNRAITTTDALVLRNADGFSRKIGSICYNSESDREFILLDTTVDYSKIARPEGKDTIFIHIVPIKMFQSLDSNAEETN